MEQKRNGDMVYCAVMSALTQLASNGHVDELIAVGMTKQQVLRLERLSQHDIKKLVYSRSGLKAQDWSWMKSILRTPIPKKYREYIEFGACNEMLGHHFRISAAQGSEWRDDEGVREGYRARKFSQTEHKAALNALQKLALEYPTFKDVAPEQLLKLAKEHELSVRSLWNQLKEWENEK